MGVLFLPPSDAYVRSFLYLLYTNKTLLHKALSNQALSLAPDWIILHRRPRILAIFSFSKNLSPSSGQSSWLRDQTCVSCVCCIGRRILCQYSNMKHEVLKTERERRAGGDQWWRGISCVPGYSLCPSVLILWRLRESWGSRWHQWRMIRWTHTVQWWSEAIIWNTMTWATSCLGKFPVLSSFLQFTKHVVAS